MAHTPGPWSVHGDNRTLIGCDDRKMMLAEVLYEHVCTEWGRPIAKAQANTRLMAAAPDLLESLVNLVNFQKGREEWPEVKAAEAAIAKATGVTQ